MTNLLDKYNLPMTVVIALIVWSWISFLSVILA
jgi:hypothetical protein